MLGTQELECVGVTALGALGSTLESLGISVQAFGLMVICGVGTRKP